jgi:CMP-N-acetylneuraminic acid synthetase
LAFRGFSVLVVVPARAGSKGIPRKNLVRLGDRSLIAHCAATVAELDFVDRAVVSTDDDEMAAEGERCGLLAPFRRPAELASDSASADAAWQHAWLASEAHFDQRFELGLWLQPTTPLRRAADVERTLRALVEGGFDSVATLSEIPAHLRPERAMTLGAASELGFYSEQGPAHKNRQTIPTSWYRNGVCYAATRETVVLRGHALGEKPAGIVVEGPVVNIDEREDLAYAEWLWQREHEPEGRR